MTDNRPGKLSICIGMPVMIKYNEATECCVTNGTEAEVVGWTSRPIDESKNVWLPFGVSFETHAKRRNHVAKLMWPPDTPHHRYIRLV